MLLSIAARETGRKGSVEGLDAYIEANERKQLASADDVAQEDCEESGGILGSIASSFGFGGKKTECAENDENDENAGKTKSTDGDGKRKGDAAPSDAEDEEAPSASGKK